MEFRAVGDQTQPRISPGGKPSRSALSPNTAVVVTVKISKIGPEYSFFVVSSTAHGLLNMWPKPFNMNLRVLIASYVRRRRTNTITFTVVTVVHLVG